MLGGLVSSVPRQEIAWEERLRNDLFCVKSISGSSTTQQFYLVSL